MYAAGHCLWHFTSNIGLHGQTILITIFAPFMLDDRFVYRQGILLAKVNKGSCVLLGFSVNASDVIFSSWQTDADARNSNLGWLAQSVTNTAH